MVFALVDVVDTRLESCSEPGIEGGVEVETETRREGGSDLLC